MQQLMLEEQISLENFKEHRARIEAERARPQNTVDSIKQSQHLIKADFEVALQLATELDFLFEKDNFDERRSLCETIFKPFYLKDVKISKVESNAPFGLIATEVTRSDTIATWWAIVDSSRTFL